MTEPVRYRCEAVLPADERAPGSARHALNGLARHMPSDAVERYKVAVSELVTNAIRHGPTPPDATIHMSVLVTPHTVRVEVVDEGGGFDPRVDEPGPEQRSGWGLYLVQKLADRWGVSRSDASVVWFEIDLPNEVVLSA